MSGRRRRRRRRTMTSLLILNEVGPTRCRATPALTSQPTREEEFIKMAARAWVAQKKNWVAKMVVVKD